MATTCPEEASYCRGFLAVGSGLRFGWAQLWISPFELRVRDVQNPWAEVSWRRHDGEVAMGPPRRRYVPIEWFPYRDPSPKQFWIRPDQADRVAWALHVSGWTGPFAMSDLIVPCTNRYWGRAGFLILNRERIATEFSRGGMQSYPRVPGQSLTCRRRWMRSRVSLRMPDGDVVGLGVVQATGPLRQAVLATGWPLVEDGW